MLLLLISYWLDLINVVLVVCLVVGWGIMAGMGFKIRFGGVVLKQLYLYDGE